MKERLSGLRAVIRLCYRTDPRDSRLQLALGILMALQVPALSYGGKLALDGILGGDAASAYTGAAILSVGVVLLAAIILAYIKVVFRLVGKCTRAGDRELMDLSTATASIDHFEQERYLDDLHRIREDRHYLAMGINWPAQWIRSLLVVTAGGLLLATIHPLMVLFPALAVFALYVGGKANKLQVAAQKATSPAERLRRALFEIGTRSEPAKELRTFGSARRVGEFHARQGAEVVAERNRAELKSVLWMSMEGLLSAAVMAGALAFGLYLAVDGRATAGDLAMLGSLLITVAGTSAQLVGMTALMARMGVVGRRIERLRGYVAERGAKEGGGPAPETLESGIALRDVSFSYPGAERPVLSGLDLDLPAGKVVALVGENGAGKTTVAKMLSGFLEPTGGEVLLDGEPLSEVAKTDWHSRIGATFQDHAKFEFTAAETVALGDLRDTSEERVRDAMRRTGTDDLLEDLPDGLDTRLGVRWENGVDLSGGQWQKLAIARGRMRRAPLLVVFDEPTAALDPQTEHRLFERFAEETRHGAHRGTVTVLISHRFSTVSMADLIVVLDSGRVAEAGTHEELVAAGGQYAELHALQSASYG
ncbi:ABC transporter ATP-binding protein [Salininema proteolyticum]|uniref:ABC transporter ATP-binding protein n=1 Tax=Salininema proteolyticum TaxID=1607685 RepID=A0ABV8TWX8_9ACTN